MKRQLKQKEPNLTLSANNLPMIANQSDVFHRTPDKTHMDNDWLAV
jgi:hypothetical protein